MEQFSTPQKTPIRSVLKEINANEFVSIEFILFTKRKTKIPKHYLDKFTSYYTHLHITLYHVIKINSLKKIENAQKFAVNCF